MLSTRRNILLLTLLLLHALMRPALAATDVRVRNYNVSRPLVYEDSWIKQPYAFIDEDGEPTGFNVELVREVMRRLQMPYEVRLRPQRQAHEDLVNDSADLSLAAAAAYNEQWGHFGRVPATLIYNSVMVPKNHPRHSYTVEDMRHLHTYVSRTGRAAYYYHLSGLPDSCYTAVPEMESEILREAAHGMYGAVWSTMNMRWTLSRYHLDEQYDMVPLDIPPARFVFISKDTVLLNRIDSVLLIMKNSGALERLEERWLYPTLSQSDSQWGNIIITTIALLVLITVVAIVARRYKQIDDHRTINAIRRQMDFILDSSDMRVWVYFPTMHRYAWMSNDGIVSEDHNSFSFSKFFPDNVFDRINTCVVHMTRENSGDTIVQQMQMYDPEHPGKVLDTEVSISGIADEYGKMYLVIGVHHDITSTKAELERKSLLRDCLATSYDMMPLSIMRFDANGVCNDVNDVFLATLNFANKEEVLSQKLLLSDNYFMRDIDISSIPIYTNFTHCVNRADMIDASSSVYGMRERTTHFLNYSRRFPAGESNMRPAIENFYDVYLMQITTTDGKLQGYMLAVSDITTHVEAIKSARLQNKQYARYTEENRRLCLTRNFTIESTQVYMMRYLPDIRRLIIGDRGQPFYRNLTQLATLFKVDPEDNPRVFRSLRRMDARINTEILLKVHTRIRSKSGQKLIFDVAMRPVYRNGMIESYLGTCTDVTHDEDITNQLEHYTNVAAAAWKTRQAFQHNMSHAMRLPLTTINADIKALEQSDDATVDMKHVGSIRDCTDRLLRLTDDTLLLSRLESGEPVIKPTHNDFVQLFLEAVNTVKSEYRADSQVTYDVPNGYSALPVLCDAKAVRRIIYEAVALSARYTHIGTISINYVYHNDELTFVVEDNSQGLPPNILAHIFESNAHYGLYMQDRHHVRSGLEMPIAKALCEACGGTIDITSTSGRGTQTYVRLPLQSATQIATQGNSDPVVVP